MGDLRGPSAIGLTPVNTRPLESLDALDRFSFFKIFTIDF